MNIMLQIWGGLFYLLAKIFLAKTADKKESPLRRLGWLTYLFGAPAWIILLALDKNWIAMGVEAGGIPSMIVGLVNSKSKRIKRIIHWLLFFLISSSIVYSVYDKNGFNTTSQYLELGVTLGFLIGTYLLSQENIYGWLWFMLMNASMAILMSINEKWILVTLQLVSLCIVTYGFWKSLKKSRRNEGNMDISHFYDIFVNFFSKRKLIKVQKKRLKKFLQDNYWDLKDRNPMGYICKYFNWEFTEPKEKGCMIELGTMPDCDFKFTIWHNKPCMEEDGPNPGEGSPHCLNQLKGDEKYFTVELFELNSGWKTYDTGRPSGYSDTFICTIHILRENFTFKEMNIGEWYLGTCEIPFLFNFKGTGRSGSLVLKFDHKNKARGECTLFFPNLL